MSGSVALREMRWWDIGPVLELEQEMFPEDAWSAGMFWSELAHARGPRASRHFVVAQETGHRDPRGGVGDGNAGDRDGNAGDRDGYAGDGDGDGGAGAPGAAPGSAGGPGGRDGGRVVGYAGLAAAGGTGDVQTIAVTRDHWGTGLGSRLLTELLSAATEFECEEVLLEVRVDNTRAQRLYERFGFQPIGFRRGYYQPGNIDALVMRRTGPAAVADSAGDLSPAIAESADSAAPAVHSPAAPAAGGASAASGARTAPAAPARPEDPERRADSARPEDSADSADPADQQGTTIHG